jgi:hypothetical protein
MRKIFLFPALTAAALALGLAACDEQPASENPSQPLQQGAVPPADDGGGTMPGSSQ